MANDDFTITPAERIYLEERRKAEAAKMKEADAAVSTRNQTIARINALAEKASSKWTADDLVFFRSREVREAFKECGWNV